MLLPLVISACVVPSLSVTVITAPVSVCSTDAESEDASIPMPFTSSDSAATASTLALIDALSLRSCSEYPPRGAPSVYLLLPGSPRSRSAPVTSMYSSMPCGRDLTRTYSPTMSGSAAPRSARSTASASTVTLIERYPLSAANAEARSPS